jgi:hypothetical protein
MAQDARTAGEVFHRLTLRAPGDLMSRVTESYLRRALMRLNAEWSTAFINDLPDSAFLYVEDGEKDDEGKTTPRSKRHFPYKGADGKVDLPHLRNAIARASQAKLPEAVISRVQARARRLLESNEKSSVSEVLIGDLIEFGLKQLAKSTVPNVWMGVSHNAWRDRQQDIIPLSLILEDIEHQTAMIRAGKMSQYGQGLWQDHQASRVLGSCEMRLVIEGGRSCFEMGNLYGDTLPKASMSIGYNALMDEGTDFQDYKAVYVYERSRLEKTIPVNARTFWSSKQRMPDAQIALAARELLS